MILFLSARYLLHRLFIIFFIVSLAPIVQANNCAICKEIKSNELLKQKRQLFLAKNKTLLNILDPKEDITKILKVKSNIVIIMFDIETADNTIMDLKKSLTAEGCRLCH